MSDSEPEQQYNSEDEFEFNSDDEHISDSDVPIDDVSTILKDISSQNDASKPKFTPLIISKYEYTKLIGVRSQMISMGAISQIQRRDTKRTPTEIAILELNEHKIPLIIRRVVNKHIIEFCDPNKMELL